MKDHVRAGKHPAEIVQEFIAAEQASQASASSGPADKTFVGDSHWLGPSDTPTGASSQASRIVEGIQSAAGALKNLWRKASSRLSQGGGPHYVTPLKQAFGWACYRTHRIFGWEGSAEEVTALQQHVDAKRAEWDGFWAKLKEELKALLHVTDSGY